MDMRKLIIASLMVCMPFGVSAQKAFKDWPDGVSPKAVGELVSKRFVEVPHPNFNGNPAPPNEITYPETCAWFGALRYADITNNKKLLRQLEERFLQILGLNAGCNPCPTMWIILYLERYLYNYMRRPVRRFIIKWESGMPMSSGKCLVIRNVKRNIRHCWIRGCRGRHVIGLMICL